ncbi:methyltransferase domain-containing protein [Rossellomorea aquimaris]|uniref:class I SAM-dependent methyltransferase n=1 Tax=Rossellomorea aquimaris TaxID=189382 RepID=UPI001CD7F40B|nr:class I SAM-dependent methyltransferase [Rossellomorea aquimaris]MCA1054025.1 methyltransferase domain-containing protein [Rossellomorea aquimaris]
MNSLFDEKTKDYAKGRPTYPIEVLQILKDIGITGESVIADIGAGTGLLTKMLAQLDCHVHAVDPNAQMLYECKGYCSGKPNIAYVHAAAEDTTLKEHTVDVITIAQAFHWFDQTRCKIEFNRILKKNGYVVILFNEIRLDNPLSQEYNQLLREYAVKETAGISDTDHDLEKRQFFGGDFKKRYVDNLQTLDRDSFVAGALSLSYTPSRNHDRYAAFLEKLHKLFGKYERDGKIEFLYQTEVCIGQFVN